MYIMLTNVKKIIIIIIIILLLLIVTKAAIKTNSIKALNCY